MDKEWGVYEKAWAEADARAVRDKAKPGVRSVYRMAMAEAEAVWDKALGKVLAVFRKALREAEAVRKKAYAEAVVVRNKARASAVCDKAYTAYAEAYAVYMKALIEDKPKKEPWGFVGSRSWLDAEDVWDKARASAVFEKALDKAGAKAGDVRDKACAEAEADWKKAKAKAEAVRKKAIREAEAVYKKNKGK